LPNQGESKENAPRNISEEDKSGDEREDAHINPKPPGIFLSFGSGHC
jgi:hypothetical protein